MSFNVITIEPIKTYATAENAVKAVQKRFAATLDGPRMFNVVVLEHRMPPGNDYSDLAVTRYFPLICNIREEHFQQVLHCGFNLIN